MLARKVIAVDFDGTLAYTEGLPPDLIHTAPAIEATVKLVNCLFDAGHFIIVYTARLEEDEWRIHDWLGRNRVNYDLVEWGKLRYDIHICDRSMHPEGAAEKLAAMEVL